MRGECGVLCGGFGPLKTCQLFQVYFWVVPNRESVAGRKTYTTDRSDALHPKSQNLCFHKYAPTPTSTTLVVSVHPEVGCPHSVTRHMITQRRPKPPKKETPQWSTILFLHWYFSL